MDHMEFQELYKMIPYVVTLVVLVLTSMRNKRENQPPKLTRTVVFPGRAINSEGYSNIRFGL